ncbi:IS21 family transposase [bacterium]|nr:IS21 family transposase [bacterium]
MITMTEFQEIIKLRNKNYTQEEIAKILSISLRTVQRYLKTGKLPIYKRNKPSKEDPFAKFKDIVLEIFKDKAIKLKPRSKDIYNHLLKLGYTGSLRTVSRKTKEIRESLKRKEIYFEQEVPLGKMAEGDFTAFDIPFIYGTERKYLWITTLKNSCGSFAKSFNNQTFESFAQGTVDSFNYFKGVPEIYRLDNLSPVVKMILRTHRVTTDKFNELVLHYNFKPSFCNPGKGNEKGSVESINKHFKDFLSYDLSLTKKVFNDEVEWEDYISNKLEEYNFSKKDKIEQEKKDLQALPISSFKCFTTEVHSVNKYGFINLAGTRYSIPSEYKYKTLELRFYYNKIEVFSSGVKIKEHTRIIYNKNSKKFAVDFRDHIDELLKKPGAFTYYKHKEAFFPTDIFKEFYSDYPDNKNYLQCLKLCKVDTVVEVEAAISLLLSVGTKPTSFEITNILHPEIKEEKYDINFLKPLEPKLDCYDAIIFKTKTGGNKCVQHLH